MNEKRGDALTWNVRFAYFMCTPAMLWAGLMGLVLRVRIGIDVGPSDAPTSNEVCDGLRRHNIRLMEIFTALDSDVYERPLNDDGTRTLSPEGVVALGHIATEARMVLRRIGVPFAVRSPTPADSPKEQES